MNNIIYIYIPYILNFYIKIIMNQTLIKVYDTEFLLSDAHEKIT